MSESILVTYATRAGSTAGVAEFVADVLREQGATVVVRPMYSQRRPNAASNAAVER